MDKELNKKMDEIREKIREAEELVAQLKPLLKIYDDLNKKPNNNSQQT